MQLHDAQGKRLYLTADERLALMAAAGAAPPVRTVCAVLHTTGCCISEALALTPEHVDLSGKAVVFETLKKRRRGVYRAVPVPPGLLDQLNLVHGLREALKRGRGLVWTLEADAVRVGSGYVQKVVTPVLVWKNLYMPMRWIYCLD